jgi:hypothetical protein
MCHAGPMAQTVCVIVSAADREHARPFYMLSRSVAVTHNRLQPDPDAAVTAKLELGARE